MRHVLLAHFGLHFEVTLLINIIFLVYEYEYICICIHS